tara:strand:- start:403 stop:816 length:414 start_codon:yes stop_codon:yes gene_type:complete
MDTSYGITAEMHMLRGEAERPRAEPVMLTAILAAYLRFSGNPHRRGTFMQQGGKKATLLGSMHALADQMVAVSPAMCMPGVSVHVVHDLSNATRFIVARSHTTDFLPRHGARPMRSGLCCTLSCCGISSGTAPLLST